ncbi:MAG: hypothetical protein IID51_05920 [Proteobacteria bacterium]|nr:hypothetical protein [Pseudomonadota bacterium]
MQEFDPLVLLLSVLSVFAVFLINRWLGGFTPAHLNSKADALARLKLDYPAFEEQETVVGGDGKSAILAGAGGGIALVQAIGDRFLTRLLGPGDVKALSLEPSGNAGMQHLRLRLDDFTNAAFELLLSPETNGAAWHKRLAAFLDAPGQSVQEAGPHG